MIPTGETYYKLKLTCGHPCLTQVLLKQQYKTDEHYVYCPTCRETAGEFNPTAWNNVTSVNEVPHEQVSDVLSRLTLIMPSQILRLQPSRPPNRQRPYPYVRQYGVI
jgi:hypothetical protein